MNLYSEHGKSSFRELNNTYMRYQSIKHIFLSSTIKKYLHLQRKGAVNNIKQILLLLIFSGAL